MQRLSKTVTMYRIPSDSSEVKVLHCGNEWALTYVQNGEVRHVSLLNSHLPSSLLCTNVWNNAAFVRTEHPPVVFTFPFGKHQGMRAEDVPPKYLEWWMKNVLQDSPEEI